MSKFLYFNAVLLFISASLHVISDDNSDKWFLRAGLGFILICFGGVLEELEKFNHTKNKDEN